MIVRKVKQYFQQEKGASALYFALVIFVLLGMGGIALDGSNAYVQRREMQNAADAAALAGVRVLALGGDTAAVDEAVVNLAMSNGVGNIPWELSADGKGIEATGPGAPDVEWSYTDDNKGIDVTVNNEYEPYFARIFGYNELPSAGRSAAKYEPIVKVDDLFPVAVNGCDCLNFDEFPVSIGEDDFGDIVTAAYQIGNANDASIDYTIYLKNLDPAYPGTSANRPYYMFYTYGDNGVFTEYGDGTARALHWVANVNGDGFLVDMRFSGRTTTAPDGQSPFCEDVCPDTTDWHYYAETEGTLNGLPGTRYEGAIINVTRRGAAMQVGTNAHLKNPTSYYGAAGALTLDVLQQPSTGVVLSVHSDEGENNMILATADGGDDLPTATPTTAPTTDAPAATPTNTFTPVPPTATSTNTFTPVPPTATPTNTFTPVPPTATPTNTFTPVPPTATTGVTPGAPTATATPVPPTATPTNTFTPVPPTATPTNTFTPVPLTPTATATTAGNGDCRVKYKFNSDWGSGFTAEVEIKNKTGVTFNGWTIAWTFAGNQQITNLWNGVMTQVGQNVQVTNASWNGTLYDNDKVSFGFLASYSGVNAKPTTFVVNGMTCNSSSAFMSDGETVAAMSAPTTNAVALATSSTSRLSAIASSLSLASLDVASMQRTSIGASPFAATGVTVPSLAGASWSVSPSFTLLSAPSVQRSALSAAALSPAAATLSCPNNLILNPSFESGTANWTGITGTSNNGYVIPDGTKYGYHSGGIGTKMYQDVNVVVGNSYSMTFYSSSHVPGTQTVSIEYLTSGGSTVGTVQTHTITVDIDDPSHVFGGPYTLALGAAPATAAKLRVTVKSNNVDWAKVDAFCLPGVTSTATATATATKTKTPVPPTATATKTNTPVPPTATPTKTKTPVPPTATATKTKTPVPPTATATKTKTPVPPTATATKTNTPVPPTATTTKTNTPVPTSTATPLAFCPSNMLLNGSFELGTVNWTGITGTGNHGYVIPDGTKYGYHSGGIGTKMYQDVNVVVGGTYSMSFYSASHIPGTQTVSIEYLTSGDSTVGTVQTHTITVDIDDPSHVFGGPYTLALGAAPATAAKLRVTVKSNNVDWAKVDALCLQGVTPTVTATPTVTPTKTNTPAPPTATSTPTKTNTPVPPTATPTSVLVATLTPTPTPGPEVEYCTYNLRVKVGESFNIRDYVSYKDNDFANLPVNWSQVYFTYTGAGANDPTNPTDWHLTDFNNGTTVTVTNADQASGTGNQGNGKYRIYLVRTGQATYDDHMTIEVNTSQSDVESAKCIPSTPTATSTPTVTPTKTNTPVPPTATQTPTATSTATSTFTPTVMPTPAVVTCNLYPIALSSQTLSGATPGVSLGDIWNGEQPGNFGWLTWAGSPNVPTLATSLTPPGDSSTYVNPYDSSDLWITIGDWVQGSPGVSNASSVRAALDILKTIDIVVPVWDQVSGTGNNALYRVVNFAIVRITDYALPNQNRITATFLGYAPQCSISPTPTPTPTATATATATPSATATATATATPTVTSTPTATLTPVPVTPPPYTPEPTPSSCVLGEMDDVMNRYTLVVLDDLSTSSDIENRAFVGGSLVSSTSANIGINVSGISPTEAMFVVVGDLVAGNPLNLNAGSLRLGGNSNGRPINFNGGGSLIADSSLSDGPITVLAQGASAELAAQTANNGVTLPSGQPGPAKFLVTTTTADGVAIFQVAGADLFGNGLVQQIELNPGSASLIVINVTGSAVDWSGNGNMVGNFTNSQWRSQVIWNFPQASSINLGSHNMMGAMLAPYAAVTTSGNIDGSAVVRALTTSAEVHQPTFGGDTSSLCEDEDDPTDPPPTGPKCKLAWLDWDGGIASTSEIADYLNNPSLSGAWRVGDTVPPGPDVEHVSQIAAAMEQWLNKPVTMALYDNGNQADGYEICGFAEFTLTDYDFASLPAWIQGEFNLSTARGETDPEGEDFGLRGIRFK